MAKGSNNVSKSPRRLSIPEEANLLHLRRIGEEIRKTEPGVEKSFLEAFFAVYAELKKDEVLASGITRLGLTFKKVQASIDPDDFSKFTTNWKGAKEHFVATVHKHSYKVCADEVGEQRRAELAAHQADAEHLTQSLADRFGSIDSLLTGALANA